MKHKIKGDITSWNSTIYDFNYKMRNVKEDEDITLEVNSYGGDVFLGIDIMNTLRAHKGTVTVIVTGIAASACSIMAMGADIVKMYSNTQLMIHHAWTYAAGNAKQLRKIADDLESIGESVLASYTHRVDEETVKQLLDEEKYMSAKVAKEYGFIDEIIDGNAEEVESEMFSNKALEFNNALAATSSTVEDNKLLQKVSDLENQVIQLQSQLNKSKEEPKQPQIAAKRKGFFFNT
ncbi:head maturation protease, ClpP-related [Lysinibacillus varians]|uniref:ATP-dependent Clp protease proteolytic subunit n=1 Tax=Lysinibacillus varians TaxID=1145276 RepID=A0ABY2T607_9BACI|nr:head maturation protease, ClpP-related [Lysinibacillus varians]AHN22047.1 peptidase S14 [Lysinibacillus varians]TKI52661.1 Clp protease ClpP [Lysinibacillus varians]